MLEDGQASKKSRETSYRVVGRLSDFWRLSSLNIRWNSRMCLGLWLGMCFQWQFKILDQVLANCSVSLQSWQYFHKITQKFRRVIVFSCYFSVLCQIYGVPLPVSSVPRKLSLLAFNQTFCSTFVHVWVLLPISKFSSNLYKINDFVFVVVVCCMPAVNVMVYTNLGKISMLFYLNTWFAYS